MCFPFESTVLVVLHDSRQVWLVLLPYTIPLFSCLQSRNLVLFGARQSSQLMPPGKQHHIWPGAMQRRLVVEALWLAIYQHIWLHKISVLLDPRKIHITWSTQKQHASETLSGAVCRGRNKPLPQTNLSVPVSKCKWRCKYAEIRFFFLDYRK